MDITRNLLIDGFSCVTEWTVPEICLLMDFLVLQYGQYQRFAYLGIFWCYSMDSTRDLLIEGFSGVTVWTVPEICLLMDFLLLQYGQYQRFAY
jgi:hypothetical protein